MKDKLTTNEKIVMAYITGYYKGTGEVPEAHLLQQFTKLSCDKTEAIVSALYEKGRLTVRNGKTILVGQMQVLVPVHHLDDGHTKYYVMR